jgi:DNA-binding beta-propeller fold protein YncE
MIARWLARFVPLSLCALAGALAFMVSPAGAAQTRRILDSFGGTSSSVVDPYPLSNPQGVAVDQETEDVYVADTGNNRVEKFSSSGAFLLAFGGNVGGLGADVCGGLVTCEPHGTQGTAPGEFTEAKFVAVDNDASSPSFGDVYVADTGDNTVSKFSSAGVLEKSWSTNGQLNGSTTKATTFGAIAGIVVNSAGELYVLNTGGLVFEFKPGGEAAATPEVQLERETAPLGLAVNSAGNLFAVSAATLRIGKFEPSGFLIGALDRSVEQNGPLTVDAGGGVYFVRVTGALYYDSFNGAGEIEESSGGGCNFIFEDCEATDSLQVGFVGSGIAATAGGEVFLSNAGESMVYRYSSLVTAVQPEEPRTEGATEVKTESAMLHGVVNPGAEGESGFYDFVYRQSATECEGEGATATRPVVGKKGEVASAVASELLPHTTYAFCLRMHNGAGEAVRGAPVTFTTLAVAPRVEGMSVSDVAATSATLDANVNPGGESASYVVEYALAGGSFAPVPGNSGVVAESNVSVPVSLHVQGLQADSDYELRVSVANSVATVTSEVVSLTTQSAGGLFALPDGRQWELVSPPDKHGALIDPIAEEGLVQAAAGGDAVTFVAESPTEVEPQGYSNVEQVFSARGPDGWVSRDITPARERPAGAPIGSGDEYVAFSEDLSLAVLQPHGVFEPALSLEASEQTPFLRTNFVNGDVNNPCVESCYRPLVTGKPGYANVPAGTVFGGCPGGIECGPEFQGATPDLTRIGIGSKSPLLASSGEYEEYEWAGGQLSKGDDLPPVRVATSEDGSWSYFVSVSVLAAAAVAGEENLYVSHGGVTSLIAVLSGEDFHDWAGGSTGGREKGNELHKRTSRVSPDGRWFAFMSQRELTGYDTHDAVSGKPDQEVYLYHAPEDLASESGTLVCASCDPTGARPVGVEAETLTARTLVGGFQVWNGSQWVAANVPGFTPWADGSAGYQSRYLSDSGRLFFNSIDALVAKDVNGQQDVYEYEPEGVPAGPNACGSGSASGSVVFKPARSFDVEGRRGVEAAGCVGLISSGQDANESAFLDASGSGGDVFFLTAARLVPEDYDTALDVYDAHECTSAAPCFAVPPVSPPACDTGDACKAAPTPQPAIYGEPSSETFSGPGNVSPATTLGVAVKAKPAGKAQKLARALRACRRRRGGRRRVCERGARARFARAAAGAAKRGRR